MADEIAQEKADAMRRFFASQTFFACCQDGHRAWSGPDRMTYPDADKDAKEHDKVNHTGGTHAGVCSY